MESGNSRLGFFFSKVYLDCIYFSLQRLCVTFLRTCFRIKPKRAQHRFFFRGFVSPSPSVRLLHVYHTRPNILWYDNFDFLLGRSKSNPNDGCDFGAGFTSCLCAKSICSVEKSLWKRKQTKKHTFFRAHGKRVL